LNNILYAIIIAIPDKKDASNVLIPKLTLIKKSPDHLNSWSQFQWEGHAINKLSPDYLSGWDTQSGEAHHFNLEGFKP
jgi:hypothetical protein